MAKVIRTDAKDRDFISLVKRLDTLLAVIDGDDHDFYDQYNKLDKIKHVVLLYIDGAAIACGAIKEYDPTRMEVKRMYTEEVYRGKGYATQILRELEIWAHELGYNSCVLETGKRQKDAVALYSKRGYKAIPNYGQYVGVENSICFEKEL